MRPRILGSKSSGLLETEEPRRYPVEFAGPRRDSDDFEIRQLSVPAAKSGDLKRLYREIADDERQMAVLKPAGS